MNTVAIKRAFSMFGLKLRKNAPTIMTVIGVAGVAGGTYLACRATYKLKDTIEAGKEELEAIEIEKENALNQGDIDNEDAAIIEAEYKKDITVQTGKNVLAVAKLYAVPAVIETASIALLIGSHGIMQKRMTSLAAAYATLNTIYNKYRQNVREQFGDDVDYDMRHGVKHTIHEEVMVDGDGNEHVKQEVVDIVEDNSEYAKFFDQSCPSWDKNPEYNMLFLKGVQQHCNNLLIANGYLFLNDVYAAIGIPKTIAGQSVGWIYDSKNPVGDNYVDFGLYRSDSATRRFVNGLENVILLDFNVDGDILNNPRLRMWKH